MAEPQPLPDLPQCEAIDRRAEHEVRVIIARHFDEQTPQGRDVVFRVDTGWLGECGDAARAQQRIDEGFPAVAGGLLVVRIVVPLLR